MNLTLRLSDDEARALHALAERESRSVDDVAREAIRAYLATAMRAPLLDEVLDRELPRYAQALDRLGR